MDAATSSTTQPRQHGGHSRQIVALIGVFKLTKGLLMLGVAVAALELTRKSVGEAVRDWSNELTVGPYRHRIGEWLGNTVLHLNVKTLTAVAVGAVLYAALFITEGVGLLMNKLWAEWLAVISTAGLIPLELFELHKKHTPLRIATVALNVAVVVYLAFGVRRRMKEEKEARGGNA